MRAATRVLWPALLLAGCAAPNPAADATLARSGGPRPALAELLRRLPAEAAGFLRGGAVDVPSLGEARVVNYAIPSRTAAAQVTVYDRGLPDVSEAAVRSELDGAVREATGVPAERTGRSLAETSRHQVAAPGGGALSCAVLDGRFGRSPVERHLCVGAAGGRFLRVQVTMSDAPAGAPGAAPDTDGFARAVATALRAG